MNKAQLEHEIRKHWTTYLPQKVKELRQQGNLEAAIQGSAAIGLKEFQHLKTLGYQDHEAEEVVRSQVVHLNPRPAPVCPRINAPSWHRWSGNTGRRLRSRVRQPPHIDGDRELRECGPKVYLP